MNCDWPFRSLRLSNENRQPVVDLDYGLPVLFKKLMEQINDKRTKYDDER